MTREKRNNSEQATFACPPSEYRGAPFWAWNAKLDQNELSAQIDCFRQMGLGGFFMHSRSGMATEYLGEEFMARVRDCIDYAEKCGMKAYLYDEDRWPSGSAGGYVTREKAYRQKQVCLSRKSPEEFAAMYDRDEREPKFLAAYDIEFDERDRLARYKTINENEGARGEKWFAYALNKPRCGYHNGYTYADTMNAAAVDKFIAVTYEAYKNAAGEKFGKSVPAIFTDEPNYGRFTFKQFARDGEDAFFPWSESVRSVYAEKYASDVIATLPELVWNLHGDAPSTARYRYYATVSELFASAFCDRIGRWCRESGIAFTGHVLDEPTLTSQMCAVGDAMRAYREFTLPGVDMLCNDTEFTTVKQAQSAARQYGRAGVASEMYGVTGWDFDFRGHKFQGDWQAALGVTLRVPHLAWLGMAGSAKRDYPASIGCQSAWYKEYPYIEDHFARLNVALTEGKPIVNVAVIHPVESAWIAAGVREHTSQAVNALETGFANITEWLLRGQIDFDFVSESLLPDLYRESETDLCVGEMRYKAVIVPPLVTIRQTTVNALAAFVKKGGKALVCGACPACVDGALSDGAQALWRSAQSVAFTEADILGALQDEREIAVYGSDGCRKRDVIYALRERGSGRWLFLAHCDMPSRTDGKDCARDELTVKIKGAYSASRYDTISGKIETIPCAHTTNGETEIPLVSYPFDSFLLRLTPCAARGPAPRPAETKRTETAGMQITVPDFVHFTLGEPNVLVLDMPAWSRDGKTYEPREEILRIDKKLRQELNYPLADGEDMQPWCLPEKEPTEFVYLRFTVESEIKAPCRLGYEKAQAVWWNGKKIEVRDCGFYVDKAIRTMPLPPLKKGTNELTVLAPISERVSLENYFLLGDFGVRVTGPHACITELPEKLAFGSVTGQGLPFYGAEITYRVPFACNGGDVTVTADEYAGALIAARLDGKEAGRIVLPPYRLTVPDVAAGEHLLELTLYASRQNTFGALHAAAPVRWKGPEMWYTENNLWAYEYRLTDAGILKSPTVYIRNRQRKINKFSEENVHDKM